MSIELVMLSNHLILCHPLLFLPPVFPRIKVLFNELALHIRWPKYWCFSIILPVNIQGLFLLGMTGLIFLQLKRLSRVFSSTTSLKALIPQCSAFFMVQLSHPYMTTGKTIALTRRTFAGKVMSLLFNMLSGLVIAFLPRSKRLLISWPQSLSAVILEPPKNKVFHCFYCFPISLPWSDGIGCHGLSFLNVEL